MPIMTNPSSEKPMTVSSAISNMCVRLIAEPPLDAEVLRRFADPRSMTAVKESSAAPRSESDTLQITCMSDPKAFTEKLNVLIEADYGKVSWQPGQAILQGRSVDTLLPAVIDFAFYEADLRRLEQAIKPDQALADADVALAYNIRESDRSQWGRLYKTMEDLSRLRLQFARLEPHLGSASRELPLPARRLFNRLLVKAQIEARLEAFSDRLEVLEDLYEGAVDRITDYRNFRNGSLLEVGIIVLLGLEVILLLVRHG
jgi:hypothetical protein